MGINATLIGQMITFIVFIAFTMRYVWPPITQAMDKREKRIADGLASAERGQHELDEAKDKAAEQVREAKQQAAEIIEQANRRGSDIVGEARDEARQVAERERAAAEARIEQEVNQATAALRKQVAGLAILGASRILEREVDAKAHGAMLDELAEQLWGKPTMAETTTVARPYAEAVFELAEAQDALAAWSDMLDLLAAIVVDPAMRTVLGSPRLTGERKAELLIGTGGERLDERGRNLVRLLSANDRLLLLPEIAAQYGRLRADAERTIEATVITAQAMDEDTGKRIASALGERLRRKVALTAEVDADLIGGAVIRAGDLVIDGSVKGRLTRLTGALSR